MGALWELRAAQHDSPSAMGMDGNAHAVAARYHDRALRAGHTWSAHRLLSLVDPKWASNALDFAASLGDVWAEAESAILLYRYSINASYGKERLLQMVARDGLPWILRARIMVWAAVVIAVEQQIRVATVLCITIAVVAWRTIGNYRIT